MSKQKDNRGTKGIEDLLGKAAEPGAHMDDFEKEALEGFAILKSEKEMLGAKEELDRRIYPAVFDGGRKRGPMTAWLAAAGIVLVIGFAVYLLRPSLPLQNNLAQKAESASPEKSDLRKTQAETMLPREGTPSVQSKGALEKPVAARQPGQSEKETENSPKHFNRAGRAENALLAQKALADTKPTGLTNESTQSPAAAADETAAGPQAIAASAPPQDQKAIEINDGNPEKIASFTSSAPQPVNSIHPDAALTAKSVKQNAMAKKASLSQEIFTCDYEGGTLQFNKDLKLALEMEGLDKKTEGYLVINAAAVVQKAVVTAHEGLTESQIKRIVRVLEKFKKFRLPGGQSPSSLYRYDFKYTP